MYEEQNFNPDIPKISVVIRKRPLSKKEMQKNEQDVLEIRDNQTVIVKEQKQKVDLTKYIEEHSFTLDAAFDENAKNEQIYKQVIEPLIVSAFFKSKVTCFAYGQTGSGKTYTMMGDQGDDSKDNHQSIPGLYLLAAQDIFNYIQQPQYQHLQIFISFYEIYCGKLYDLLNDRQQLQAREDAKQNINIIGLQEKRIINVHSIMQLIGFGMAVRVTSSTGANFDSSRSHAILQICLKEPNNRIYSKISFIDLAGNERAADVTNQNKQTRVDGAEINKSLLALKECIRALDQDKNHIPFRGSKLTLVLKDSFLGNCKTVMIGNVSPNSNSCEHTLNTLRYADRVKELKNPNSNNEKPNNSQDLLAQQLMLPRQTKNCTKINLKSVSNYQEQNQQNEEELLSIDQNNFQSCKQFSQNPGALIQQQNQFGNFQKNFQKHTNKRFSVPVQPKNNQIFEQNYRNFHQMQTGSCEGQVINEDCFGNQLDNQQMTSMDPQGMSKAYQVNSYVQSNQTQHCNQSNGLYLKNQFNSKKIIPDTSLHFQKNINSLPTHLQENQFNNQIATQQQQIPLNYNSFGLNQQPYSNSHEIESEIFKNNCDTEESLNVIQKQHENLIQTILQEEEEIIFLHRKHIDDVVELTKQEMNLIHEVDNPGSDVDNYIENLDSILDNKKELINLLQSKLKNFKQHLKEEESLSNLFIKKKNQFMNNFYEQSQQQTFSMNGNIINQNLNQQIISENCS